MSAAENDSRVFRPAGISYLHVPASDPRRAGLFYHEVFGWTVDLERSQPSFEDGSGHVIGHFIPDAEVAGEAGIRPYVYVDDVEQTLARATAHGGEVVRAPYPEGDLRVATFRDPEGNVVGIWQRANADVSV